MRFDLSPKATQVSPAWYALYTRHHHEKAVSRTVNGKGLEFFLPLYSAVRQWKDRTKQIQLPLFPCYVFVRCEQERWESIVTTPGLNHIVSSGGHPAMIPPEEIAAIRRLIKDDGRIQPHPFLKYGDRVRVRSGPLEGMEGILTRKKNQFRLVVSIQMLEKSVAVEIDAAVVEKVPMRQTSAQDLVRDKSLLSFSARSQMPAAVMSAF